MLVDARPGSGVQLLVVEDFELWGVGLEIGVELRELVKGGAMGGGGTAGLSVRREGGGVPGCGPEGAGGCGVSGWGFVFCGGERCCGEEGKNCGELHVCDSIVWCDVMCSRDWMLRGPQFTGQEAAAAVG